jgi:glycosyltransferase involved in cell wall biosynthesis
MPKSNHDGNNVAIVAILRDEGPFLKEWIAYHHVIGVDHFFLYDHSSNLSLRKLFSRQAAYITVFDWPDDHVLSFPRNKRQTSAYNDSIQYVKGAYQWVAFIDGDEFVVLRRHENLKVFLASFPKETGAVFLNWHIFGHNGYYEDPPELVIKALTRRMVIPSVQSKSISRVDSVTYMKTAHEPCLKGDWKIFDANGKNFNKDIYPGKTEIAHINHYVCRSFKRWMNRIKRGNFGHDKENIPAHYKWRFNEELLLKKFVQTIAKNGNELVDDFMHRFEKPVQEAIEKLFE